MLSRGSQYAIRALAHLARIEERPWTLARQIAADLTIPAPFLSKILRTLASHGLLESQRGRRGGFRLARDPARVSLYQIVEPFERLGPGRLCVLGQKVCADESACALHFTWKHSVNAFVHRLQTTTLIEISRHPSTVALPELPELEEHGPPQL